MSAPYRVSFMGSPDFAVPVLQALLDAPDFTVVGVVTQPDRPAGRGGKLRPPAVKVAAEAAGLPLYQPEKLRGPEAEAQLRAWNADVQVVAAYGQILRQHILNIAPYGSINVHASLLPRWRGAAPIQAAVRAGDAESGITIMQMDAGLDTGPMLLAEALPLSPRETGGSLHDKLAAIAGPLLLRALRGYLAGDLLPQPQDDAQAIVAPQIKKEEGHIDWTQAATAIDRHVRAFHPAPGTYSFWAGKRLKILAGEAQAGGTVAPGAIRAVGEALQIGTGEGLYVPSLLQLEGKKALPADEFLRGNQDIIGTVLD